MNVRFQGDVTMCIWGVAVYYRQEMDSCGGCYTICKMTYPNLSKSEKHKLWTRIVIEAVVRNTLNT